MLKEAFEGTMRSTAMIMLIILAAVFLNFILGFMGVTQAILEGIKEQVVEVFVFCCGHGVLTLVDGDRMLPASQREVMRFVPTA